jgi:hypothetical protein
MCMCIIDDSFLHVIVRHVIEGFMMVLRYFSRGLFEINNFKGRMFYLFVRIFGCTGCLKRSLQLVNIRFL